MLAVMTGASAPASGQQHPPHTLNAEPLASGLLQGSGLAQALIFSNFDEAAVQVAPVLPCSCLCLHAVSGACRSLNVVMQCLLPTFMLP